MDRRTRMLWMQDILDHMQDCYEQWRGADPRNERYLAEAMKRDADEFRRLCQVVREDSQEAEAADVEAVLV